MYLTKEAYERIRCWMSRQARPLEAALWRYYFEGGCPGDVTAALSLYQNSDGGFGHALEPDLWNPGSTPYTTLHAVNLLQTPELREAGQSLAKGALNYFRSGAGREGGLWRFTLPENDRWPHAPWWHDSAETNARESLGLSAAIASFILQAAAPGEALYETALWIARRTYDALVAEGDSGEMFLDACCALAPQWFEMGLMAEEGRACLARRVAQAIAHTPQEWAGYVPRPSRYIQGPQHPLYPAHRALVEAELDYLITTLPEASPWPINWHWGPMEPLYPKAFALAENWAMASQAISNLRLIKAYGRLEGEAAGL